MSGEEHSERTDDRALAEWRRDRALRELGSHHSSEDCHELVLRLKAQAQCLEEILSDIRRQIDELEYEEILDHIREQLFEADT